MSLRSVVKRAAKFTAFKIVYPAVYNLSRLRRVDSGKIIFAEIRGDKLSDNFRLIYDRLKEIPELNPEVFFVKNNEGGFGYLWRYAKLAAAIGNARCVLINETCNLFGAFKLRDETMLIQTWHGCGAFKKWGKSVADLSFGEDSAEMDKYPAHTNYTLCTVSSPECVWAYREAFGLELDDTAVQPVGVSRTDFFFDENSRQNALNTVDSLCPKKGDRKIILYAPTFRGDADKAYIPQKLDITKLKENFADKYVLLIKQHEFVKKDWDIPEDCRDFAFDVSRKASIQDLLITADICITDYSSLIFEFSLMEKPMIFYAFDLEKFYDSRGFYYSYDRTFLPGDIACGNDSLCELIKSAENDNGERARAFKERFMSACDGRSTDRIVDFILEGKESC